MSQIPPLMPPGVSPSYGNYAPQGARTSGNAVASLVCGILGCVPLLTSIAAIVTGIFGLRATRNPSVGGRGMAIAGIILGVVGLAGWGIFGGSLWVFSAPERTLAHRFIADLSQGNSNAAAGESTGNVSQAQLSTAAQQLQTWGGITGTTVYGINVATDNGVTSGTVGGNIYTPTGTHHFQFQTVDQNGTWKIDSFVLK